MGVNFIIFEDKKIFMLAASLIISPCSFSADMDVDKHSLTVIVNNIKTNKGQIICNLFKPGDDILHAPSMQKKYPLHDTNNVTVVFEDLPYGHYVVFSFHDKNNNGDLDHNFIRMPNEPMGYSNNWNFGFTTGMPTFEKTEFYFSEKKSTINIKLK